ncbi:hypothetical protein [Fischerella sp. PCC 9605]|uniref:hypothetical protein n=1 Tax=Fischerella sp. PCC 9605 TaxID=1173024 RepID=UPI003FA47E9B
MDFRNRVKGAITQTLIKALLEDAGYRVIPLGVEEIIREVKNLSMEEYIELGLSKKLRSLPDFLITDYSFQKSWLVEVKYRKRWNKSVKQDLGQQIREQVKIWQPLYLVVFLGSSVDPRNDTPANRIGAIKLVSSNNHLCCCSRRKRKFFSKEFEEYNMPWEEITWKNFRRIQDIFPNLSERWEDSTLIQSLEILKALEELDLFE